MQPDEARPEVAADQVTAMGDTSEGRQIRNHSRAGQAASGGIQGSLLKSWVRASMAGMSCFRVVER